MSILLEYAKSSASTCKGCKTKLTQGELRVGEEDVSDDYGIVKFYHLGCLTGHQVNALVRTGAEGTRGYKSLRETDKARVKKVVQLGRVPDEEIPAMARPIDLTSLPQPSSSSSNKKRPRNDDVAAASSSSQAQASTSQATSTQGDNENEEEDYESEPEEDVLILSTRTQVVGIQHYRGVVGIGEQVTLVREPNNPYDRNAVRVLNIRNIQVGHIPATVASRLAPLMDRELLRVEGEMLDGTLQRASAFKLNIELSFYAPESTRSSLLPHLRWAPPAPSRRNCNLPPLPSQSQSTSSVYGSSHFSSQTGLHGPSPTPKPSTTIIEAEVGETPAQTAARQRDMQKVLATLKNLKSDTERGEEVLDALVEIKDVLSLPLHPSPPGISSGDLKVDLLPHQSQGLLWMLKQEAPKLPTKDEDQPVQLVQYKSRGGGQKAVYLNLASRSPTEEKPTLARGGLLADAMGLGKTLQCIATIVMTLEQKPEGFSKGTLIICPLSVLSNWEKQMDDHVSPRVKLTHHVYHGTGRDISIKQLSSFDVVLTTYSTMSGEISFDEKTGEPSKKKGKKTRGNLFQIDWKRIVLDEGHTIKNPKAKVSKAACALSSWSRWVVTGTPIVNEPGDLGSILTFLQTCSPLHQPVNFKRLLLRPLADGAPNGVRILKAVMSSICLRRTKEMEKDGKRLVDLPELKFFVVPVELGEEERRKYDKVATESQRQFERYLVGANNNNFNVNGGGAPTYANVLSMLTRLRQLCLHESLVPDSFIESLGVPLEGEGKQLGMVGPEEMGALQKTLRGLIEQLEECAVCFDQLKEPRILPCSHAFCKACIEQVIDSAPPGSCPYCRGGINKTLLIEYQPELDPTNLSDYGDNDDEMMKDVKKVKQSSKVEQLIKLLKLTDPDSKSLVFSQFTSFLTIIEDALDEAGVSHVRFDGSMAAKKREAAIATFSQPLDPKGKGPQSPRVMLLSLKAGALGLNLTVANNVFLMDPWWAGAIESQACERVYRIGQKKPVKIFQLVASNSVEDKVLEIQKRKDQLVQQAFSGTKNADGGTSAAKKKAARVEDMRELFAVRT